MKLGYRWNLKLHISISATNVFSQFKLQELSSEEKDDYFPLPFQDFFSIVLFSPVSWEVSLLLPF